jgi:hypothetical protein
MQVNKQPDTDEKRSAQSRWRAPHIGAIIEVVGTGLPAGIGIPLAIGIMIALPICVILGMKLTRRIAVLSLLTICALPALIMITLGIVYKIPR